MNQKKKNKNNSFKEYKCLDALNQGQNIIGCDQFIALIFDFNIPDHHTMWFLCRIAQCFWSFLLTGQFYLNGIANFHRLYKAQVVHAIVGNDRAWSSLDE